MCNLRYNVITVILQYYEDYKMALTTAQIHAAASAIDATGQKPTLTSIRAKLGSGSYSTIKAALETWEKAEEESQDLDIGLPEDLQAAADLSALTFWHAAVKLAARENDQDKQNFQDQLKAKIEELREVSALVDSMDVELADSRHLASRLAAELEDVQASEYSARVDITKLLAHVSSLETLSSERLRTIEALEHLKPARAASRPVPTDSLKQKTLPLKAKK